MPCHRRPSALLLRTFGPAIAGLRACRHAPCALPPQAFGLTSGKGGLVRLDCWTANSSFWSGHTPCPTSSDRRRPSASQNRCPRRARWSFPSYSPESLSLHSTIGSRNRRQISFPELPEVTFVVRQGYFAGSVLPEGTLVALQARIDVPVPAKRRFVVRLADFSDIVFTSLFQVSF